MTTAIELIKQLRQETGAGVQDCRKALEECRMDYAQALEQIKEKMALEAAKFADRETSQGWLETYSHGDGRLAVVVEINTETDFAAKSPAVREFGREIALQIAAANPVHVREEDIPTEVLSGLRERTIEEAQRGGKPAPIAERMVEGRIRKYVGENVLLAQPYIRDESVSIAQLVGQVSARIGEKIQIGRFIRWEMESARAED